MRRITCRACLFDDNVIALVDLIKRSQSRAACRHDRSGDVSGQILADVLHGLAGLLHLFADDFCLLSPNRPEFLELVFRRFERLLVSDNLTLELVHLLCDFVGLVLCLELFERLALCFQLLFDVLDRLSKQFLFLLE